MPRTEASLSRPLDHWLAELLDRVDPARRRTPLPLPFLVCFGAAFVLTIWLLAANKYLPGQDIPYHAHCSRVWLDGGKLGSPYANYEPGHALEANTLMYTVAGLFSHVMGSFSAFRLVQAYYLLGLPLACLYALRDLDRSPWGSLLAFPLCYTEVFAAGFANMTFAAPTFVLALVMYRRLLERVTWQRGVAVSLLFIAVFLSHAQVYLWLGGLLVLYSLGVLAARLLRALHTPGEIEGLGVRAAAAIAAALPSILLFARWYARGYGRGRSVGALGNNMDFASSLQWLPLPQKFMAGALQAFTVTSSTYEVRFIIALWLLLGLAMAMARAAQDRSPPLPELAVGASVISYYLLPDGVALQMVAVRQWYFVFWLLPLVIVPVSMRKGPFRSFTVALAIVLWTASRMSLIASCFWHFTHEEMVGFDHIVAAAPRTPGLTVAFAAINAGSKHWHANSMYHAYGFLDAQRSYDGPLEYSDANSVAAIRYTNGPPHPIRHLYGNPNWPADSVVWQYDLVLVYRWSPTPAQEKAAREHGSLVASAGDWQLWQRNKP
ncbi:MAG TPA: hypothetical protein VM580_06710 [Labilithrix sp.]|nr:hypothetical protein [Labilithrix sp.]